uniref:Sulfatase N-terminal domain-containing protein n=2 Tax=Clastoptera arizonana TaxID=38151 RepID=A0A1B6DNU0_9HEMI
MAGIRNDQDILDRTGWHMLPTNALGLNVLIFGFDSLSHNTFIRKLPKSYAYLKEELNVIALEGYNIVGDGTPQALIPILTGKTELEMPDTRKRMGAKATHVNVYPFIWNQFKNNGYVTAFMEDTPSVGIFTYRLKGFNDVPTDHYMRPFYVEAEPEFSRHKPYCIGSLPRHKIMMDYAKNIFTVYKEKPKFIFGFHGELSHDHYNLIGAADNDLLEWLQWFHLNGHLNNTLLIIMSDHGHRFADIRNTQQGKLEERLPWFSFVFPPWFEHVHPRAMANFKTNAHRLTTPFDIYPTLANLLHFEGTSFGDVSQRSISLFKEIPAKRTCADAFIEPHWCTCLNWEKLDLCDKVVKRAALEFVNFINSYNVRHSDRCADLKLEAVLSAAKLLPSKALRKFNSAADLDGFVPDMSGNLAITMEVYQIKLSVLPGGGIFEVSLTYHLKNDLFKIRIEDVSRINKYGTDAACIEQSQEQLRKYCYCKH